MTVSMLNILVASIGLASAVGIFIYNMMLNRSTRQRVISYSRRVDRLGERLARESPLRELAEPQDAIRLNMFLDGDTVMSLYQQTLQPGGSPAAREVEEAVESNTSATFSLWRLSPSFGRKKAAIHRASYAPENEPVRAVIAVENSLRDSGSVRSVDLASNSNTDAEPVVQLIAALNRNASLVGITVPESVKISLIRAWTQRNTELTDQGLAGLTGFVKVRADFSVSVDGGGDILLEASLQGSSTLNILCRQDHLLPAARTVLVPGEAVRATCFGSVTRWDSKRQSLSVLPISVYS